MRVKPKKRRGGRIGGFGDFEGLGDVVSRQDFIQKTNAPSHLHNSNCGGKWSHHGVSIVPVYTEYGVGTIACAGTIRKSWPQLRFQFQEFSIERSN